VAVAHGHDYITDRLLDAYINSIGEISEGKRYLFREAATVIKGRDRAMAAQWSPIETAPTDRDVLLWWRPRNDDNIDAEACVIGRISESETGKWWNGQRGEYQDIWHVTHWKELPTTPRKATQ
jgi:hypothetical protein